MSYPWAASEVLEAQATLLEKLHAARAWCKESRDAKATDPAMVDLTASQKTSAASVPPYTPHLQLLIDVDVFRNLDDSARFWQAFRACRALARMDVPDDTTRRVKDWLQGMLQRSAQFFGWSVLFKEQVEILKWIWIALWKCGCEKKLSDNQCVYCDVQRRLGEGEFGPGSRIPVKTFIEKRDDIIEHFLYPPKQTDEKKDDENEGSQSGHQCGSNVPQVQKPNSFRLEPGASGNGTISTTLQKFCRDMNVLLDQDAWLAEKVWAKFHGSTSGEKGCVLRVYSYRSPKKGVVGKYIDWCLRQNSEAEESIEEVEEEMEEIGEEEKVEEAEKAMMERASGEADMEVEETALDQGGEAAGMKGQETEGAEIEGGNTQCIGTESIGTPVDGAAEQMAGCSEEALATGQNEETDAQYGGENQHGMNTSFAERMEGIEMGRCGMET